MHSFDYIRAGSIAEAAVALAEDPDATLIAGGQTLIPTLKQRLAAPAAVIDISRLPELHGIERDGDTLVIRAMTPHAIVAGSAVARSAIPGLAELAGGIGDPQVRHRGTIGGSVANNDPAADYPAACLALGATIVTERRRIAAEDFFADLFTTALQPGEIVTAVRFPMPRRMAYAKFRNPASRYAMAGVCVAVLDGGPRVAVTGAGQSGVFRWTAAEAALSGRFEPAALDGIEPDPDQLSSDIHAQADYRAALVAEMARRAVAMAASRD